MKEEKEREKTKDKKIERKRKHGRSLHTSATWKEKMGRRKGKEKGRV